MLIPLKLCLFFFVSYSFLFCYVAYLPPLPMVLKQAAVEAIMLG